MRHDSATLVVVPPVEDSLLFKSGFGSPLFLLNQMLVRAAGELRAKS